ncbi:MAG: hypothetical protein JXI33_07610 [Candidatus Aminicenantes bacterium]|nr:hypothetical protein [Candidatus Aminicenantes bacterium]
MNQRMTVFCLFGWILLAALNANAQTTAVSVDWKGLEEAWHAYYSAPTEEGADKILKLLPGTVKIIDIKDGFVAINAIQDHLSVLEGEIYSGNPNAIKLGFRLYTISYGALEVALNKVIGNLISFFPRLFLEELSIHRDLFFTLEPILGSFVREMAIDPNAQELEKNLRIKSLESVEEKPLKALRNECIKILKKL